MIDGWVKSDVTTFISDDYQIIDYGDRNTNQVLNALMSFNDQFLPTLSQLNALEEAGLLELEVDGYWDTDTLYDEKYENQSYVLILLRRKK